MLVMHQQEFIEILSAKKKKIQDSTVLYVVQQWQIWHF